MNFGNQNGCWIILSNHQREVRHVKGQRFVDLFGPDSHDLPPERVLFPDAEEVVLALRRRLKLAHDLNIPVRSKYH